MNHFTFSYQVIPSENDDGKTVTLFQYSDSNRTCLLPNMKGGNPVTVEFIPEKKTKDITVIRIGPTQNQSQKI